MSHSDIAYNSDLTICNELEENSVITTVSVIDKDNCLQGNCGPFTFDVRGPPMAKYQFITEISKKVELFGNVSCHLVQCFDLLYIGKKVDH